MFHFCLFTPKIGEDEPILTSIFFKWVETTNQKKNEVIHFVFSLLARVKQLRFHSRYPIERPWSCRDRFLENDMLFHDRCTPHIDTFGKGVAIDASSNVLNI